MGFDDFLEGLRDRVDPIARSLSLVTVTRTAEGTPRFAAHIPGTYGGARNPDTGYIESGRTAHEVLYPIASQLSLVTPTTNPDGSRGFDLHIPFTKGTSMDPYTKRIGDGQTAGETVQHVTNYATNTIRETTTAILDPIADAADDATDSLSDALVPLALIAAAAYVLAHGDRGSDRKGARA